MSNNFPNNCEAILHPCKSAKSAAKISCEATPNLSIKKSPMKIILAALLLFATLQGNTQKKYKSYLLMNGTAHLATGEVINNSLIGFENGKLNLVANALITTVDTKKYDTIIQLKGKHIYPGFIASNIIIGLVEIEAARPTLDFDDVGEFNPNVRSLTAFNTDSKILPTVRANGVLLVQSTPRGGIISGSSSVMKTNGWNWEDAVISEDDGIHLNWPRNFNQNGWWAEPANPTKNDQYKEKTKSIRKFLEDAKAYNEVEKYDMPDLRYEAMRGIFKGKKNLYVHTDNVKEMMDAINLCKELSITKMVIVGGYDSWMITDMLKENKVSVMLRGIHELPMRTEDDIDMPFKLPKLLQDAGILFCIQNEGNQEASHARNLPFMAGTAAGYGITQEQALAAITLNTAKILGIDKMYGSLEENKSATLFVSEGDALDMKSNKLTHAFINGEPVELHTFQDDLNEKYLEKYELKK
jgi:imidazolonepropionase-like amidohydrolase